MSILHSRRAITLIEVLAAIFVISIGLLGVLAVIPFGIFQVSKAREAENVANMLVAAADEVEIMGLTKVSNWVPPTTTPATVTISSMGGPNIYTRNDATSTETFNCARFFMLDPFDDSAVPGIRFYKIGANFTNRPIWEEIMRGQDDLVYTTHRSRLSRAIEKRTDFSGQNNVIASSGKYTWFMTFAPPNATSTDIRIDPAPVSVAELGTGEVNVDLLGCYNRVPGTEREVAVGTTVPAPAVAYMPTLNGAQITLQGTEEELDLSKTKYIFISWAKNTAPASNTEFQYGGTWCKIAYAPKNRDKNGEKTIVVTGALDNFNAGGTPRALIVDGILYHKPVTGLTLF